MYAASAAADAGDAHAGIDEASELPLAPPARRGVVYAPAHGGHHYFRRCRRLRLDMTLFPSAPEKYACNAWRACARHLPFQACHAPPLVISSLGRQPPLQVATKKANTNSVGRYITSIFSPGRCHQMRLRRYHYRRCRSAATGASSSLYTARMLARSRRRCSPITTQIDRFLDDATNRCHDCSARARSTA